VTEFVEHLKALTATRDRELMALALAATLKQALGSDAGICLRQPVGDGPARAWVSTDLSELAGAQPLPTAGESGDGAGMTLLPSDLQVLEQCLASGEPRHLGRSDGGCVISLPVGGSAAPQAVLELNLHRAPSDSELRLMQGIVQIHGNLLALLDYSERDTLTGLLNRKTYDEAFLRSASARTQSSGDATCCVLGVLDIDHFKRVNDSFGHLIGDEVLLLMARLMRANFRHQDGLYRFGGEEFVVLMRCRHADEAASAFERLRASVEAFGFPQVGRITVSIGYTVVPDGDTPASAFERADQAVYHAKHQGRNLVFSHEALIAEGVLKNETKVGEIEFF
jgi:diguanylate cyclase (GGDEF)-like protein